MAAFFREAPENIAKRVDREVLTLAGLAPWVVLAINTAQGTVRKEDCSGAARAADGRLLAEVWPKTEDARQNSRLAIAELASKTVDAARSRAEPAGDQ